MSPELIWPISKRSTSQDIFILGHSTNDIKIADEFFDKVLCLEIDEDTTIKRVMERDNNNFGKDADQLSVMRKWHAATLKRYKDYGAVFIDANQPIDEVVDEIIESVLK